VIALIATIFFGYLFIVSIQTFFKHLNKDPHHLFSHQPVGAASTGQLFCTLLVLGLFFLTAYFPLFMAFITIPRHKGEERPGATSSSLTYMAIDLGYALTAGALLALVSHRRYLHFGQEEGTLSWKKGLDIAIIGFIITFIAIRTLLAALPSTFEHQSKTALNVVWAMDDLRVAFYSLAIIDIFVSAACLWRRLKAAGIYDQAIFNLCFKASVFFIAIAIFNIIEHILYRSGPNINYDALLFSNAVINGVYGFFGMAWVLPVHRKKVCCC
jgi:hypothetical protein